MRLADFDPCPIPDLPALADQADTFDRWRHVDGADPGLGSYDPWLCRHLERVIATASGWSAAIDGSALAAALGYFVTSSLLDPPPGLPTVRAFQRAQAEVLLRWPRERWD